MSHVFVNRLTRFKLRAENLKNNVIGTLIVVLHFFLQVKNYFEQNFNENCPHLNLYTNYNDTVLINL